MTTTMTHSYEVTNVSQKPGPMDMSAGVMTPLCLRQCVQSPERRKKSRSICCDKFERVHTGNHADTRVFQEKVENLNKTAESSDSYDSGKSVANSDINVVCAHQPF